MIPVEIELLVKDSTKAGVQRASASIDRETMKILGQIDRIQTKIDKLKSTNIDALDQDKSIAEIKKLEGEIDRLQAKMVKLSAKSSIGPSPSEIEKTTRQYNGLNYSIQQIARELPAAAMGPQMFFMAISNNLPIFTDELARARAEYKGLIADGKTGIPVWKQILSSIVSWQTALTVGIMLLVTYGDEIGQWVTSLFKGKEAMNANAIAAERFHATMVDGARNAQTEVVKLNLLYKAATDNAKSMDERREAADRLKDTYPEYFSKLTTEQILLGQANEQYKTLVKNIYDYAKAQAAFENLVAVAEKEQTLQGASSYEKYLKLYEKLKEARSVEADAQKQYDETPWTQRGNASEVYRSLTDAQAWRRSYQREADAAAEVLIEELSKIPGGTDVVEMINEQFNGEIGALIDALQAQRQTLEDVATSAQLTDDPTKTRIKKQPKADVDKQGRDLLLQAARDLEDDQNAIIQDGYEKRRAIAKTAFERQLHDIRENREKLFAEDEKETGGANKMHINTIFDAQVMAVATQYRQTLSQIDKDQQTEATKMYDDLLKKYETYLQGRERLTRQYDKDIAALSASPENQEVAEQAKEKALADFDVAFASQFPQFEQWANAIITKSVEKLRELIALAEFELENMETDTNADPDAVAKTRASIAVMRQTLANAKSPSKEGGKDSFKEWEQLSEVLGRVQDDLKEIGEAFGDMVGEVIDAAGSIASSTISIISGIQTLTETSVKGVETTSEAASTAISSAEKASVILTVISAVFSIIQTLAKVFKDVETEQERNIRLAREFNEELRIMNERARIDRGDDSIFGDAVYENFRQNIDVMRQALRDLDKDKKAFIWRQFEETGRKIPGGWESDAASLADMQVQVKKRGRGKYASLGDLVPELFGDDGQINMDALAEFADDSNETFQNLSDSNKKLIKSMVADWETYEQALESVKDYLSSIFGELGETILDSMISVADGTMTAADAMTARLEALSGTVKQFAKNMIYAMTIGPILKDAEEQILQIQSGPGTEEEKYEAMLAVLDGVLTDVEAEQDVVNQLYNRWRDMAAAKGIDIDQQLGVGQTGKAGAMYTVSQDSFTRAEGILTSIQAHIASGDLKLDNITAQLIQQLDVLNAIATNTAPIAEIYALLMTMQREGIRVV